MALPIYFSSLRPFKALFRSGQPILTYHHVGKRQAGARIKGLYVSADLFRKQLAELAQNGFRSRKYYDAARNPGAPEHPVYVTFDDGFADVWKNALPVLGDCGFQAIQFLVSGLIGKTNEWQQRDGDVVEDLMDDFQVKEWLAAGHQLGSHTKTHPYLTKLSPAQAREEISSSKKMLEDRFGRPIEHFCYPYGDWNAAVRDFVLEAGYQTACTTEPGINTGAESAFELRRFTARYPSRNLKQFWRNLGLSRPGRKPGPRR